MGNTNSKSSGRSNAIPAHPELSFCGSFSRKWNENVFLDNELLTSKILSVLRPHSERGLRAGDLECTPHFLSTNSIFASLAASLKEQPRSLLLGPDGTPVLPRSLGMTIAQRGTSPSSFNTAGAVSKFGWVNYFSFTGFCCRPLLCLKRKPIKNKTRLMMVFKLKRESLGL